jgi:putative DNA primase/helicase
MDIAQVVKHVPQELRQLQRWVGWRYEMRHGKRTKVPTCAHFNANARVDDPSTWATFRGACCAVSRFRLSGVALVLTKSDSLTVVDLDKCRDAMTGVIEPWALSIVLALCSYTEVSPSGSGLHIIVRGNLPEGRRRIGKIEMYDNRRAMAMTGAHLDFTPATVEERTAELHALHARTFPPVAVLPARSVVAMPAADHEVLEKASRARNGAKFDALFNGTHRQHSASEADLALCRLLAYWTDGDAAQMDRLFRQSRLMRPKWDERRGDRRTYGEQTIDKALGSFA